MKNHKAAQVFILGLGLFISSLVSAAPVEKGKEKSAGDATFYIYADRGSRLNHYAPSGWMGDFGDLKLNQGWVKADKPATKDAKKDKAAATEDTCIQIKYTAERKQGAGWGGIYWQHPANNWGDKRGGFDLSSYTKLTFWAKGERGDEVVDKFFIGGITGQTEEGDSDEASIAPVSLGKEWKQYTIDLKGLDLSHIIGGFGFAANADANPKGFNIYVDEIRLEK
ncbi:MAG: hypothetical protein ACKVQC_09755 [Elusimicrobiota bacterium]